MTGRQRGVLAATGLGLFLVFLDAMIANLALPDIQQEFGGGESTMQLVVVAYSVGMALCIMPSATWADRSGRRLVFVISVVVFSAASLASGLAPALWALVAARGIQGMAAAAVSVTSLALVSAEFDSPEGKARAIGIWTAIAAVGLGVGPTLGGFLTEEVGWRAVFLISVPVGVVVVVLTFRFVSESRDATSRRFDVIGQVLFAVSIVSLSIGVVAGPQRGWLSPVIVGCFVLFAVTLVAFVRVERSKDSPMMDVRLFEDGTYSWAIASVFALYFLIYGALLLVTQYWQNVRDFSPIETGLLMLPFAFAMMLLPPRTGKYIARVGPLRPARIGLLTLFFGALSLIVAIRLHLLASAAFVVLAVGVAFAGPALTALSMSRVRSDRAGMASGIFSAQRAIGSTIGYAVMGSVLAAWLGVTLSSSLQTTIPDDSQREAVTDSIIENASPYAYSAEIGPGEPIPSEDATTDQEILDAAKDDFIAGIQISLGVGAVLLLITWLLGRFRYARPPSEPNQHPAPSKSEPEHFGVRT